jgi:hemerythrin
LIFEVGENVMSIEWNEKYQVGNPEVDASQKALFDLTHQLQVTEDWMALRPLIVQLYKQMRSHFALEEALMQQAAYPEAAAHAAQHQDLLSRLDDRSMDVGKGHMNKKAIVAVMTDWADQHVCTDDAALTQFLVKAR